MRNMLLSITAIAALAGGVQVMAQTATSPSASSKASPAATADTGAGANTSTSASAGVSAGLPVKDSTGATIGQVSAVNTDAAGKRLATIKMGPDTFSVEADKLGVQGGAAVINATQAQIRDMIKPQS